MYDFSFKKKKDISVFLGPVAPYAKNQLELSSDCPSEKGQVVTSSSTHSRRVPSVT